MRKRTSIRTGLIAAICFAAAAAGLGVMEVGFKGPWSGNDIRFITSVASFGFLVGVVFAFDPLPEERDTNRPGLRTVLGAIAGLCLGLLWPWPVEGIILSVIGGGVLGYAGISWAKYF